MSRLPKYAKAGAKWCCVSEALALVFNAIQIAARVFDSTYVAKIDSDRFRNTDDLNASAELAKNTDPEFAKNVGGMFQPKGKMNWDSRSISPSTVPTAGGSTQPSRRRMEIP